MKPILTFLTAFLLTLNVFAGNTVYVKTDGVPFTSIGNHTSWATATSELQTAIDSLHIAGGGEVWVAAGTYYPTLTEDPTISFYPRNNVIIYGGFSGTETAVEERLLSDIDTNGTVEPWEFTYPTIFSGELSDPYHIVNGEGTDSTAIVNGVTIYGSYDPYIFWSEKGIGLSYIKEDKKTGKKILYLLPVELKTNKSENKYRSSVDNWKRITVKNNIVNEKSLKQADIELSYYGRKEPIVIDIDTIVESTQAEKKDPYVPVTGVGAYYSNLHNCIIRNNLSNAGGGGVAFSVLKKCYIAFNETYRCYTDPLLMHRDGAGAYQCVLDSCKLSYNYGPGGAASGCELANSILNYNLYYLYTAGASHSNLLNCDISNNRSYEVASAAWDCSLTGCTIRNNFCDLGAGGIVLDCIINNCIISNNRASWAAINNCVLNNSRIVNHSDFIELFGNSNLINCLVSNNGGGDHNGSLFEDGCNLINCSIVNNEIGSIDRHYANSYANCIIWGNRYGNINIPGISTNSTVTYSAFEGGYEGERNIVLDSINELGPQFMNPSDYIGFVSDSAAIENVLNADWSLQSTSPCVDAGNNDMYGTPYTDIVGNERFCGTQIDMGAFESQSEYFIKPDDNGIVYIKEDGIGNGSSWDNAAHSIRDAYAASGTRDVKQIWVASGTYYPTLTDDSTISFCPRNNVVLYGGFAGTETDVEDRQLSDIDTNGIIEPWEFTNQTILSGELSEPFFIVDGSGTDTTAILDGVAIKGPYIPGLYSSSLGIGQWFLRKNRNQQTMLYLTTPDDKIKNEFKSLSWKKITLNQKLMTDDSLCSFKVEKIASFATKISQEDIIEIDTIVYLNTENANKSLITSVCGALYANLRNCIIKNNITDVGPSGAVYSNMTNCLLCENITGYIDNIQIPGIYRDGAVVCSNLINSKICYNTGNLGVTGAESCSLKGCVLENNYGTLVAGYSTLVDCIIANNSSLVEVGVIYISDLINCTITNNMVSQNRSYLCSFTNCIIWHNRDQDGNISSFSNALITYSAVERGHEGEGNIVLDTINELGPQFMNPSDYIGFVSDPEAIENVLKADWSLQSTSPCIDMGNNDLYDGPDTDLAGNKRILCGVIDMGAYESKSSVPPFSINYIEETTNRPIPSFMAYNSVNEFTGGENYGNGQPVPLQPDTFSKKLYFRVADSDTTEQGLDSLYIPPRPADPAAEIDYPGEILTGVTPNTFWNATGGFTPVQAEQSLSEYIPEAGNPEDTVTLNIQASDTSFAALNSQDLAIIPRPDTPSVAINYPNEIITSVPTNAIWDISGSFTELTEGEPITVYIPSACEENIQTHIAVQATDTTFRSHEQILPIPSRPASPEVGIDYVEESLTGVEENTQWDISGSYDPIAEGELLTDYIPDFGLEADTVKLVFAATDTSFHSDEQALAIPARPAPPTNPNVNDNDDTFGWDWSKSGYEEAGDYENSIDNGIGWSLCSGNPLSVGNVALPTGYAQVRVQASNEPEKERFRSEALLSDAPFTVLTALNLEGENKIKVYPTVTRGFVYCNMPDGDEYTIEVYNFNGTLILSREDVRSIEALDLSACKEGLYLVKIRNSQPHEQVFKIIKL